MARSKLRIGELQALPGDKARRFVNVETGEIVSRRQAENLRARSQGFSNWSSMQRTPAKAAAVEASGWRSWIDYVRARRTEQYQRFLVQASDHRDLSPDTMLRPDSQFNQGYLGARAVGFDNTPAGRNPNGKFADFLVYVGFRDEQDAWDVGDTNDNIY